MVIKLIFVFKEDFFTPVAWLYFRKHNFVPVTLLSKHEVRNEAKNMKYNGIKS